MDNRQKILENKNIILGSKKKSKPKEIQKIKLPNPEVMNIYDNRGTEERPTEENLLKERFYSIPECFREEINLQPEEIEHMRDIAIVHRVDPDLVNRFEYNFKNIGDHTEKDLDLLSSYLDNHNHHMYKEFKKMLIEGSSSKLIGSVFIKDEIDVEYFMKKLKADKSKHVMNIKRSIKRTRTFEETNDTIPANRYNNIHVNWNCNRNNNLHTKNSQNNLARNSTQSTLIFSEILILFI